MYVKKFTLILTISTLNTTRRDDEYKKRRVKEDEKKRHCWISSLSFSPLRFSLPCLFWLHTASIYILFAVHSTIRHSFFVVLSSVQSQLPLFSSTIFLGAWVFFLLFSTLCVFLEWWTYYISLIMKFHSKLTRYILFFCLELYHRFVCNNLLFSS